MLKYISVAPLRSMWYLLGRGMARAIIGGISVVVVLGIGMLFLSVPIHLAAVNWPLFVVAMSLGLTALMGMGLLLAGVSYLIARHAGFIGEAVSGALYLFTGSIFPLDVLPAWLQPIGYLLPMTYWLEAVRRALLGSSAAPTFAAWNDMQVIAALAVSTLAWCVISVMYFRYAENRARQLGLLDWQTQY
jgi:ABC-2 type transport system permease protein